MRSISEVLARLETATGDLAALDFDVVAIGEL
jgi:hypothetical protein